MHWCSALTHWPLETWVQPRPLSRHRWWWMGGPPGLKGWLYLLVPWWSNFHVDFPSEKQSLFYCRCGKQRAALNSTCLVCVGLINLFHKCENDWPFFTLARTTQLVCINRDEFCSQSHTCNKFILILGNTMGVISNLYLWDGCILSMKYFQQNFPTLFAALHKLSNTPMRQRYIEYM